MMPPCSYANQAIYYPWQYQLFKQILNCIFIVITFNHKFFTNPSPSNHVYLLSRFLFEPVTDRGLFLGKWLLSQPEAIGK